MQNYLQRIGYLQVTNKYLLIDTVIYVSLLTCLFVLLVFFPFAFAFYFGFCFFPPFFFQIQFKVDLN